MGLFARVAAKGEARTMAFVEEAITTFTDLDHGLINIPCHIKIGEKHAGIWVGSKDDDGKLWVGVYRCQLRFWGVELDEDEVQHLKSRGDVYVWLGLRQMHMRLPVTDLGRMDSGAHSLAIGLATLVR